MIDDPADQARNPILVGAEAKYVLTLAMAVPGKGNAAPWIAKCVADWLDGLGSQTVTLKCDNEPAILAPAQETGRLREEEVASPSSSILRRGRRRERDFLGKCVARASSFDHRQCQEP